MESEENGEWCKSTIRRAREKNTENCAICGSSLVYLTEAIIVTCAYCGKEEQGYIYCSQDHYVCEECHGKDTSQFIADTAITTTLQGPLEIAEKMIAHSALPMLGCEYASIAAGALAAALRNSGRFSLSDAQVLSAIERTRKQSISGYCGLTGVCGIPVGIGAVFSVVLDARCGEDKSVATTMRVVGKLVDVVADAMGPSCCQRFVRDGLKAAVVLVKEYLNTDLSVSGGEIQCRSSHRHPHGCHGEKCSYYGI